MKTHKVQDLRPFQKVVNLHFIVLEKKDESVTKDGLVVCRFLVADETASVMASLWGSDAKNFKPGDILKLTGGTCSLFKQNLTLNSGRHGGPVRVGEFTFAYKEHPNLSSYLWEPAPSNPRIQRAMPPEGTPPGPCLLPNLMGAGLVIHDPYLQPVPEMDPNDPGPRPKGGASRDRSSDQRSRDYDPNVRKRLKEGD